MRLRVLDVFSGIGGFSLGLERTGGFETVAFCEIEPYCRRVLAKHWPNVRIYEDVRSLNKAQLDSDGIAVDVITGGFPCQDISVAGKRAGIDGERSGLWAVLARLIGELRPRYAILENVPNLLTGQRGAWFARVLGDLAALGFDAEWHCIPASAVGAHHKRDRVWIIAYPDSQRGRTEQEYKPWCQDSAKSWNDGAPSSISDAFSELLEVRQRIGGHIEQELTSAARQDRWSAEPDVGRVANGVSGRVDRLRGLGNAVVPQIPEIIGRAILKAEAA